MGMNKKIGYLGGGFKPYTKGHHFLVESAAKECDVVYVIVGQADRARPGEHPILGSAMMTIWKKFLIPIMPGNVTVSFAPSPIRVIYEMLGAADKDPANNDVHVIYGDNVDLEHNFAIAKLSKYMPRLVQQNKIVLKPFKRASGINISGTMMRKYLQLGLKDEFIAGLPTPVQPKGDAIFSLLGGEEA